MTTRTYCNADGSEGTVVAKSQRQQAKCIHVWRERSRTSSKWSLVCERCGCCERVVRLRAMNCVECGCAFKCLGNRKTQRYCSTECNYKAQSDRQRGEANPHWKGGSRSRLRGKYVRLYRKRYPEKAKAHNAVKYAVRVGKLTRGKCEVCGAEGAQAHHDDYSKPLDVRWLCMIHHKEHHRQLVMQRNMAAHD